MPSVDGCSGGNNDERRTTGEGQRGLWGVHSEVFFTPGRIAMFDASMWGMWGGNGRDSQTEEFVRRGKASSRREMMEDGTGGVVVVRGCSAHLEADRRWMS